MDLSLSAEQEQLRQDVITFARDALNEGVLERDRAGEFSREGWRKCGEFGLLGLMVPEEYGGQGRDVLTTMLAMEALGYGCRDNGLTFAMNAVVWTILPTLAQFGTAEQKERFLPGISRGEIIPSYAMTEPESGSDAYSLKTRAEKCEGGYLLNGVKALVTFAPIADLALVFASTNPAHGSWGLSLFAVERGAAGFTTSPEQEKMGLRTAPIGRIFLENCFVSEKYRIGPEGAGASIFNAVLEYERGFILSSQVGAMEYQLERAVEYAQQRRQFGQPVGKFQSVSNRIADMKLRLEIARLLLYKAAWQKNQGQSDMLHAALTNLYLADAFVESSMDAVNTFGGAGYLTETEVERDLRDAVGGPIYAGTADIQRNIIARRLGL
jgi:alkylation response protein AidB-like acyl-CoA dehydrogenase